MRKAIQPLTRKLATRLARKDATAAEVRSTSARRSAIPFLMGESPSSRRFKHPSRVKPEIWAIADVSGSVAAFGRFTLHLVHAISSQFSSVRSFVFIDGIDEVTGIFERLRDRDRAISKVNLEADVVWADGHSDYGHALTTSSSAGATRSGRRRASCFLDDARNNYHASQAWVIREIHRTPAATSLLSESGAPLGTRGSGDSILEQYAQHCDAAFECRNLRQLEAFVEHLAEHRTVRPAVPGRERPPERFGRWGPARGR